MEKSTSGSNWLDSPEFAPTARGIQLVPKQGAAELAKPRDQDWINSPEFQIVEQETLKKSRFRQDEILQAVEELPMTALSRERQDKILFEIDQQKAEQRGLLERLNKDESDLLERSRDLQDKYLAEVEEQNRILDVLMKRTAAPFPDLQQQMAERKLLEQSRARQDKILEQILRKRETLRDQKKAKPGEAADPEGDLRGLARKEIDLGKRAAKASDAGDRKTHDALVREMDALFDKRQGLLDRIRRSDPKKAERLYDELYLGK